MLAVILLKVTTLLTALSFDDGYSSHIWVARLLAKMGIKATFYCITHLRNWDGKALLNNRPENIKEIYELGHEVGSHTCTHPDLTKLPNDRLKYELETSRNVLEEITGEEIVGMAYPFGVYNEKVLKATSKYYCYARSGGLYKNEDIFNKKLNKFFISTMTYNKRMILKNLPKLPISVIKKDTIHPVMLLHDVTVQKLFALILYLKGLNASFVTVRDLVSHLERAK